MEFKVIFIRDNGHKKIVDVPSFPLGLVNLDEAREKLRLNFPALLMKGEIEYYYMLELQMSLNEEEASKTGLFLHNTVERVEIATTLNKFVKKVLKIDRNPENDDILSVYFENRLDEKEVFEAWMSAGCPLEWNP